MAKKCPPGVICFENFTLVFFFISVLLIIYYIYNKKSYVTQYTEVERVENIPVQQSNSLFGLFPRPSFSFSNVQNDVLLNPYSAPLKDDRFVQSNDIRGGIPINVSTRAVDTTYRQVGLLTRINGPETLLPLMGRPLYTNRSKWQYYTMNDSNNQLKLPISFKGKSCTNEYGCDDISNGDSVYVEGMNDAFKVTLYDNAVMKYIPFI